MAEANKIYGGYIQKDPKVSVLGIVSVQISQLLINEELTFQVIRGSSKKLKYARWLVRKTEFGPDNYPSFANGPFYFVSYSLIGIVNIFLTF